MQGCSAAEYDTSAHQEHVRVKQEFQARKRNVWARKEETGTVRV